MKKIKNLDDMRLYIIEYYKVSKYEGSSMYDKVFNMENDNGTEDIFLKIHDDFNGKMYATKVVYGRNGYYVDILSHRYYLNDSEITKMEDERNEDE